MKRKFLFVGAALLAFALLSVIIVPVWAGGGDKGWSMLAIDGGGQVVVNQNAYHNSTIQLKKDTVTLSQAFDPTFENESSAPAFPAAERYNNAFLIGYRGYQPSSKKDVVWTFDFKINPNFYGPTGFVIERKDTFAATGEFQGPNFDFFGISYLGPENVGAGFTCLNVVNSQFANTQPLSVDPFQWNAYEIRFHKVDATNTLATVRINGQPACEMTIADKLGMDANWNVIRDFNNKPDPQSVTFRNVTVKMKK